MSMSVRVVSLHSVLESNAVALLHLVLTFSDSSSVSSAQETNYRLPLLPRHRPRARHIPPARHGPPRRRLHLHEPRASRREVAALGEADGSSDSQLRLRQGAPLSKPPLHSTLLPLARFQGCSSRAPVLTLSRYSSPVFLPFLAGARVPLPLRHRRDVRCLLAPARLEGTVHRNEQRRRKSAQGFADGGFSVRLFHFLSHSIPSLTRLY